MVVATESSVHNEDDSDIQLAHARIIEIKVVDIVASYI